MIDMPKYGKKYFKKRLGAFPSKWDSRNYRVNRATLTDVAKTPKEYTGLLEYGPVPVPDQNDVGLCVGEDGAIVMETTNTLLLKSPNFSTINIYTVASVDLSAGWLYHWSRHYSFPPIPDNVEGSTNFGLMKALHHKGTALESDVPTDNVAPWDGIEYDSDDEERAKKYAIDSYWNVNANPNDVKTAIYGLTHKLPYLMPDGTQGKAPLVSAYPVYESFGKAMENGVVPMPKSRERLLGGHSSAIFGWKIIDNKEYFINYNSWGESVGNGGIFYLPVDYPFYPNDWFLIHNGPPTDQPSPCKYGNGLTGLANWFNQKVLRNKGSFKYVNVM